jgi:hypothetical protein
MDLFGIKFCVALGACKLRFVLMLEDDEDTAPARAVAPPHHLGSTARMPSGAQARQI